MAKMNLYTYTDDEYKSKHAEKITLLLNPESVRFSKEILYRVLFCGNDRRIKR